jgi:hypothetical protein
MLRSQSQCERYCEKGAGGLAQKAFPCCCEIAEILSVWRFFDGKATSAFCGPFQTGRKTLKPPAEGGMGMIEIASAGA